MVFDTAPLLATHLQKYCSSSDTPDSLQQQLLEFELHKGRQSSSSGLRPPPTPKPQPKKEVALLERLEQVQLKERRDLKKQLERQQIKEELERLQSYELEIIAKEKVGRVQELRQKRQKIAAEEESLRAEVAKFQLQSKQKLKELQEIAERQARQPTRLEQLQDNLFEQGAAVERIRQQKAKLKQERRGLEQQLKKIKQNPSQLLAKYKDQPQLPAVPIDRPTFKENGVGLADGLQQLSRDYAGRKQAEQTIERKAFGYAQQMARQNRIRERQIQQEGRVQAAPPTPVPIQKPTVPKQPEAGQGQRQGGTRVKQRPMEALLQRHEKDTELMVKQLGDGLPGERRQISGDLQRLAEKAEALNIAGRNAMTPSQSLLYSLTCLEIDQLKILETLTPGTGVYEFRYQIFRRLQAQRMEVYEKVQRARVEDLRRQNQLTGKEAERSLKKEEWVDEQRKALILKNLAGDIKEVRREGQGEVHFLYLIADRDLGEVRLSYAITNTLNERDSAVSEPKAMLRQQRDFVALFHPESRVFEFDARRGGLLQLKLEAFEQGQFRLIAWSQLFLKTAASETRFGSHKLKLYRPPFYPGRADIEPKEFSGAAFYVQVTPVGEYPYINLDGLGREPSEELASVNSPSLRLINQGLGGQFGAIMGNSRRPDSRSDRLSSGKEPGQSLPSETRRGKEPGQSLPSQNLLVPESQRRGAEQPPHLGSLLIRNYHP